MLWPSGSGETGSGRAGLGRRAQGSGSGEIGSAAGSRIPRVTPKVHRLVSVRPAGPLTIIIIPAGRNDNNSSSPPFLFTPGPVGHGVSGHHPPLRILRGGVDGIGVGRWGLGRGGRGIVPANHENRSFAQRASPTPPFRLAAESRSSGWGAITARSRSGERGVRGACREPPEAVRVRTPGGSPCENSRRQSV
jgi:hypothetical protein